MSVAKRFFDPFTSSSTGYQLLGGDKPGSSPSAALWRDRLSRRSLLALAVAAFYLIASAALGLPPFSPSLTPLSIITPAPTLPNTDGSASYIYQPRGIDCTLMPPHVYQRCFTSSIHWAQENGLVYVPSPDPEMGPRVLHPIIALSFAAEKRWFEMVRGQSQSLLEAKREYRRRYGIAPPKGFGVWWKYAKDSDVFLPDEYDQIMDTVIPLLSLTPYEIKRRLQTIDEERKKPNKLPWAKDTILFKLNNARLSKTTGGSEHIEDLSAGLEDWMVRWHEGVKGGPQDMALAVWPHQRLFPPLISAEERNARVVAAREGRHLDTMRPVGSPAEDLDAWAAACPEGSPMRKAKSERRARSGASYVTDWRALSDVCQHPELQTSHAVFHASNKPEIGPLWPLLSLNSVSTSSSGVVASMPAAQEAVFRDEGWNLKKNLSVWRGETTGIDVKTGVDWGATQRGRLVRLANDPAAPRTIQWASPWTQDLVTESQSRVRDLQQHLYDIKLVGDTSGGPPPTSCSDDDGCRHLSEGLARSWTRPMKDSDLASYKFRIDIDGDGPSRDFRALLNSSQLPIKIGAFREWNSFHLIPWFHFIPAQTDLSDLENILAFYIGLPPKVGKEGKDVPLGRGTHLELGPAIVKNGQDFVRTQWRDVDRHVYMARLLLEWQRLFYREEED